MIRFPSGNVDILVFFLFHSARLTDIRCLVDKRTGENRESINMSTAGLSILEWQAFLGIILFTSNDYISSFFCKRKKYFWKKLEVINNFWKLFRILEGEMNSVRN